MAQDARLCPLFSGHSAAARRHAAGRDGYPRQARKGTQELAIKAKIMLDPKAHRLGSPTTTCGTTG